MVHKCSHSAFKPKLLESEEMSLQCAFPKFPLLAYVELELCNKTHGTQRNTVNNSESKLELPVCLLVLLT